MCGSFFVTMGVDQGVMEPGSVFLFNFLEKKVRRLCQSDRRHPDSDVCAATRFRWHMLLLTSCE